MKIIITSDINPNTVGDGTRNQKDFLESELNKFLTGFGFNNVKIITEDNIPGNDQVLGNKIRKNLTKL